MSAAPLARSRPFVHRYYERRREVLTATPRDADPQRLYDQLVLAALPDFAQWVCVADFPRNNHPFSRCLSDHEHSARACEQLWASALDVEGAIEDVVNGEGTRLIHDATRSPRVVVLPLFDEDRSAGAVVLARGPLSTPWSDDDLEAAHEVVTALGVDLERLRLRLQSRSALRASQRVASQLHQLISASITVGTLSDESAIAQTLARSARSVFDADRAIVALGHPFELVVGSAQRGRIPRVLDAAGASAAQLPFPRTAASEAWREGDWLCAPVLDGSRRTRGVVAAHRPSLAVFNDEDRELAMLVGQLAATSLEALDLNRTIHHNETRLRILVDAAPVGIVECDDEQRVRWWNRSASRLLRWPEFSPEALSVVAWPETVQLALSELWRDLLAGGLRDTHEFVATLGVRERLLAASMAVLPSGDRAPTVLTLLDDITDQRELREEVRHAHRMELRGQVASSVAHDFNNLITLIMGYTELLSRSVDNDPTAADLIRDIQSTSSRASTLTAQLLSIGRTSPSVPVRLDLAALLSSNAEVLERIMGQQNNVRWALDDSTPPVTVDADLCEQMILNFSINARDAMPDGGTLSFSTATHQLTGDDPSASGLSAGPYVVLRISDTGTGMDDATVARCFDPLFTTKGPFEGTGLGLASARRLVEDSRGMITCSSQPGVGTTFSIWLPASTNDVLQPVESEPTTPPRARIAATILLCEDDPGVRRLALQVLRRNGFEVLESASAEDALEVLSHREGPIDLLVSDVILPQMSGPELAARLQDAQPGLLVILMSGTAAPDVLEGLAPHTATFVAKPFKPSALVDEVIGLLGRRSRTAT